MSEKEVPHPEEDIQETQPSGSGSDSSDQASRKQIEDKKMTEVNGEINYHIKKGTQFVCMTNFSVAYIG